MDLMKLLTNYTERHWTEIISVVDTLICIYGISTYTLFGKSEAIRAWRQASTVALGNARAMCRRNEYPFGAEEPSVKVLRRTEALPLLLS